MPNPPLHWFFRYKIYHIPFWCAYHAAWWTIITGDPEAVLRNFNSAYGFKSLFYVIFQALGVYFNLYVLIPKLLAKRKYGIYTIALLLTTIAVAAAIVPGYFLSSQLSGLPITTMYGAGADNFFHFFRLNTFASSVASMTLAMSLKLTKDWLKARQHSSLLEKEKLETELKFLKSQLNPHFLFNTINSIFVLIPKNPSLASATLARFSELLRYQLYECNDAQIPLEQELVFVRNFVELEKLRQEKDLSIQFNCPEHTVPFYIAPFVMLPFIENAFKHVAHSSQHPGFISISIQVRDEHLEMRVENARDAQQQAVHQIAYGGIGLGNVQRRLDLLYPGKYTLVIDETPKTYKIKLLLNLTAVMLPVQLQHP